jgi:hypothetical protein
MSRSHFWNREVQSTAASGEVVPMWDKRIVLHDMLDFCFEKYRSFTEHYLYNFNKEGVLPVLPDCTM